MKPTVLPQHRLRWQMSLSYIVVVVVALLALLMGGLVMIVLNPSLTPAEQLVQLLETHPIVQAVARQLQDNQQDAIAQRISPAMLSDLNVTAILGVTVVDRAGKLITMYDMQHVKVVKGPYGNIWGRPEARGVVRSAFANDQRRVDLVYTFADGVTVAAVPLRDTRGSPIGVFYVAAQGLRRSDRLPSNPIADWLIHSLGGGQQSGGITDEAVTVKDILPFALLLILVISVVGVGFGALTAGRLTRRMRRIMTAVHNWSQGRFDITIVDRSADELGQLVRDLNSMAGQVQTLLHARQELTLMEERQRVARDLHDSVKQHTFAITLLIGAAQTRLLQEPEVAQGYLVKAVDLADRTRQELTAILQQLRPPALSEKGLKRALQDYTLQWSQQTGIVVDYTATSVQPMPIDIEETLFRVAQEALANVARHSHASRVTVQLEYEPLEQVCLTVRDNGQGFEAAQAEVGDRGQGLTNMRERAQMQRGSVSISSGADGTCVRVCIPLATMGAGGSTGYE